MLSQDNTSEKIIILFQEAVQMHGYSFGFLEEGYFGDK